MGPYYIMEDFAARGRSARWRSVTRKRHPLKFAMRLGFPLARPTRQSQRTRLLRNCASRALQEKGDKQVGTNISSTTVTARDDQSHEAFACARQRARGQRTRVAASEQRDQLFQHDLGCSTSLSSQSAAVFRGAQLRNDAANQRSSDAAEQRSSGAAGGEAHAERRHQHPRRHNHHHHFHSNPRVCWMRLHTSRHLRRRLPHTYASAHSTSAGSGRARVSEAHASRSRTYASGARMHLRCM